MLATKLRDWAVQTQDAALTLLLPAVCRLCEGIVPPGGDFCHRCERELRAFEAEMLRTCRRCGRPSPIGGGDPAAMGVLSSRVEPCRICAGEVFSFDEVIPLWPYRDRVCEIVVASKYHSNIALADAIGSRLGKACAMREFDRRFDYVTFVPSHWSRELVRGGVSARTISEAVSREIHTKCRTLLAANRRIGKQAWLDDNERVANVQNAFRVRRLLKRSALVNSSVLVVDDVLTTGATANEIAKSLKSRGASRVTLAVVARTIRNS